MARKKKAEEHENLERWLISYADFITLLFAFFVVLYAMSAVNTGKYKILAESLSEALKSPTKDNNDPGRGVDRSSDLEKKTAFHAQNTTINNPDASDLFSETMPLDALSRDIKRVYKGFIQDGRIEVRDHLDWVEIIIQSSLLFYSGDASLNIEAQHLVIGLANFLSKLSNPITVEGYTDDVSTSSKLYSSNWDLSAARAVAVVRALIEGGVPPIRLVAAGYGENFPISKNTNAEGRSSNRRVILLVEKNSKRRSFLAEQSVDKGSSLPQNLPVGNPNAPDVKDPIKTATPVAGVDKNISDKDSNKKEEESATKEAIKENSKQNAKEEADKK
jgi:chemotaxis protein MotB